MKLLFAIWWIPCFYAMEAELRGDDLQRPIAIEHFDSNLVIANRDSGSISMLDLESEDQIATKKIGERLSDLSRIGNSNLFVATDEKLCQVTLLSITDKTIRPLHAVKVDATPLCIQANSTGTKIAVSLLWARRVVFFEVLNTSLRYGATLNLEFAPRELVFLPDDRLIVADSFGGQLLLLDPSAKVEKSFSIPGHNIRGLAFDAKKRTVLISHQMLNEFVPNSRDHVFWGNVVSNFLRSIRLDDIEKSRQHRRIHGRIMPLGESNRASGDPDSVIVSASGATVVALAGVHEISVRQPLSHEFVRLHVGRRPVDLTLVKGESRIAVANMFEDSISLINLKEPNSQKTIKLSGPSRQVSSVERGEELFFDATLSLDGWFSCHSCHTDGHTNNLLNDNLGDDDYGKPKRIISLLGVAGSPPWAWHGGEFNLTDQVRKSLYLTLHGSERKPILSEDVMALTSYLRTLESPPGVDLARNNINSRLVSAGRKVFEDSNCSSCHRGPNYTSQTTEPIGVLDKHGIKELNPPSLKGVSQQARFLHDGRSMKLRDVFEVHDHHGSAALTAEELKSLIAFLRSI